MSGSIGSVATDFGAAAGDLFSAAGSEAAAQDYSKAAGDAQKEAVYATYGGQLQLAQQQRTAYQTISAGQATGAANGMRMGGSAANIMRSSQAQAALAGQTITANAGIQAEGYQEQAEGLEAENQSASATARSDEAGAAGNAIGGVIGVVAAFL
jgi:hypothetical protein